MIASAIYQVLYVLFYPFLFVWRLWVPDTYKHLIVFNRNWAAAYPRESIYKAKLKGSIVVIGDSFALGYGDTFVPGHAPGLARHLLDEICNLRNLRVSWSVFNCGHFGALSRDWLPKSERPDNQESKKLFDKVFYNNPKTESVEIVIIMLGFDDARSTAHNNVSPQDTLTNISSIARVLNNLGKRVYVIDVPTHGDLDHLTSKQLSDNAIRNELLKAYLASNKDGALAGPSVDYLGNYEYRLGALYHKNEQHFSAQGYRKLAKDLIFDGLDKTLTKIQFERLKSMIL